MTLSPSGAITLISRMFLPTSGSADPFKPELVIITHKHNFKVFSVLPPHPAYHSISGASTAFKGGRKT